MRKIYEVLPKLDNQLCGYKTCGEFARAVAYRKAACYGCVSGGLEVAAKVCEIMGTRVPEEAVSQFAHRYGFYQLGSGAGREIGAGMRRGLDRGRGTGRGGGMGRGFGRDRRRSRR